MAYVVQLFDRHLTGVGVVFVPGKLSVHEQGLVLARFAAAGELERATSGESVGASSDDAALPVDALVLGQEGKGLNLGQVAASQRIPHRDRSRFRRCRHHKPYSDI